MPLDVGRVTHLANLMHRAEASNGSAVASNWILSTDGTKGVEWRPESAGTPSYGSNANDVGNASAPGASSLGARTDHVHRGVRTVTSNGSNGLFGDVNLSAGTGIAFGVSGQSITVTNTGTSSGGTSVSYASNSNEVSYANAPGASALVSRADHVHRGVTSVSHTSNTFSGPVILTTAGSLAITVPTPGTFTLSASPSSGGGGGLAQSFVGYNTIGGTWVGCTSGRQIMKKITLASAAQFQSLDVYLRANTDNWATPQMGILADNAGAPGLILAASTGPALLLSNATSGFPHAGRWVSFPVTPYLAAGDYWLAFNCNNGTIWDIAKDGSGSDVYHNAARDGLSGGHASLARTTTTDAYSIRASVLS